MKKVIAFVGAYTCYYVGDFFSRLTEYDFFEFLWKPYQKLMLWSADIQEWGKLNGPWKEPINQEIPEKEIEY